jgi:energy-coupling factor transport system permease protein
MKGFLDYSAGNTFLHELNPLTKLVLSLMICIASFVSNSHIFLILIICLNLAIGAAGGIFNRAAALLKGLIKISIVLFIIQVLFVRSGKVLIKLPLDVIITDKGLVSASLIVLCLVAATMPMALMLSVTKMNDLSNVLVSKLHIPYKYAFTLTTSMRFIPIFANEMSGIIEAQTSRGVKFDTKNPIKRMALILPLCVPLLITSVKKIDGSAISAEIRGFDLRTKDNCYKKYDIKVNDICVFIFSCVIVFAAIIVNHVF